MIITEIICAYCGTPTPIRKSGTKPNKYCSRVCSKKAGSEQRRIKIKNGLETGFLSGKPIIHLFYDRYKSGAVKKKRVFALTIEQFNSFWKKKCHYCGFQIPSIGIDRMDSSIGYSMDNCVPCCTKCNLMKRHIPTDDFINHCKLIALNNSYSPHEEYQKTA